MTGGLTRRRADNDFSEKSPRRLAGAAALPALPWIVGGCIQGREIFALEAAKPPLAPRRAPDGRHPHAAHRSGHGGARAGPCHLGAVRHVPIRPGSVEQSRPAGAAHAVAARPFAPRPGPRASESSRSPRHPRSPRILVGPPQRSHLCTSIANTRFRRIAHPSDLARDPPSPCDAALSPAPRPYTIRERSA